MMGVFVPLDEQQGPKRISHPLGYVITESGCWEWVGAIQPTGYGRVKIRGRAQRPHRHYYERLHGPIPEGLTLDHLCRNRNCVNPEHMEPVTNRVNVLRGIGWTAQNARKTHCPNGHPFAGKNLRIAVSGFRICRECKRIGDRARRRRQSKLAAREPSEATT